MIKAVAEDKLLVLDILCKSFALNKSVHYIVGSSYSLEKGIYALINYSYEVCQLFGDVFLSDDRQGCALLLYPQRQKSSIKSLWLNVQLIFRAIGVKGILKTLRREAQVKAIQPPVAMAYLWFIGVEPVMQGRGIGSRLLSEIISYTSAQRLPLYLETSVPENLDWYKQFGFESYDRLSLTYSLYFLKRNLH
ncbi:GNAT family N-acetyltransferase [Mucilaginibacter sp. SP1R1]|uniref:GNAT family N-acetyltransferase n=1 Tax=Mucilaginibacter sp. SP1R1 TaxID=2723091 RepID=UPI001619EF97|nr:GNAT family N-acetyltransferase [Mucilaginibacter sp. SP1R1]MBB6152406.1 hypothetical protein [Mucilaginibacter sp. SP1R1]